ncbi:MAG TPA: cupin domain-containing protein [Gaiellaceae bacterium]|nr:cupin domain-containing protein [Gaiellaceae bacterium]
MLWRTLAAAFPQSRIGAGTDDWPAGRLHPVAMGASYAITWQEADRKPHSGRLELKPRGLAFEGSNGEGLASEEVPYDDLAAVRIARAADDRLSGRPTLVLERRAGLPIRIASVVQPGIISELAEHLAAIHLGQGRALSRVVVVLPLKEGARDRAATVLDHGPPFDPQQVGLDRHQVFLTDHEAVFLFEADETDAVNRLVGDTTLWAAGAAWKDLVAGPPRLAQDVYSWVRVHPADYLSFEPTPGPGDSEGGDLYSPQVRLACMGGPLDIAGVRRRLAAEGGGYEIVHRSPGLEIGVYVLVAPEPDRQQPHEDDEVYVVLEGRGVLTIEGDSVTVEEGKAAFVPAGADHRFTGYEGLSVLVVFTRPHGRPEVSGESAPS